MGRHMRVKFERFLVQARTRLQNPAANSHNVHRRYYRMIYDRISLVVGGTVSLVYYFANQTSTAPMGYSRPIYPPYRYSVCSP